MFDFHYIMIVNKKKLFFSLQIEKKLVLLQSQKRNGSVAQLNRASDYGSEGCRFESCRSHQRSTSKNGGAFFLPRFCRKLNCCLFQKKIVILREISCHRNKS